MQQPEHFRNRTSGGISATNSIINTGVVGGDITNTVGNTDQTLAGLPALLQQLRDVIAQMPLPEHTRASVTQRLADVTQAAANPDPTQRRSKVKSALDRLEAIFEIWAGDVLAAGTEGMLGESVKEVFEHIKEFLGGFTH